MISRWDGVRIIADVKLARWEASIDRAIKRALAIHKRHALAALATQTVTAAAPVDPINSTTWDTTVEDEVGPAIDKALRDIARGVGVNVGLDNAQMTSVMDALDMGQRKDQFIALCKTVGSDLKSAVNDSLAEGVAKGESLYELKNRLNDEFDVAENNGWRIAHTEVHDVAEQTKYEAADSINQQYPGDMTKSWVTVGDDRVRETHDQAEQDNQDIPYDQPFMVGGFETDYPGNTGDPGEDINCRCAATFTLTDSSGDVVDTEEVDAEDEGGDEGA